MINQFSTASHISMPSKMSKQPETLASSIGIGSVDGHYSVAPPLHLSATFRWPNPPEKPAYDYTRSGNPTRNLLAQTLCELEAAEKGIITSSGMAAINLILCLLQPDDLILAPNDCYGGTHRLLNARAKQGHFRVKFVDFSQQQSWQAAVDLEPRVIFIETPSNPLLRIFDIRAIADYAKSRGCSRTLIAADNTFLSPALQNPLKLGCDIVVHSTTKYINGHSDIVGGAVLAKSEDLGSELSWWANCLGLTAAPFDCYLTLRGLRTLFPRIQQQQQTALKLAEELQQSAFVKRVYYPGLKSHPGHDLAKSQQHGFGAMLSVDFHETIDPFRFLQSLKIFTVAESLGGFESLACLPAAMTHASIPAETRRAAGISDTLLRFSVGLEHYNDLRSDLNQALQQSAIKPKQSSLLTAQTTATKEVKTP